MIILCVVLPVLCAGTFPLYLQCDPRWGNDQMGTVGPGHRATICGEGCAMTSTAMALAGLGIRDGGEPLTPKTFNQWLIYNRGYICMAGDCDNLNLTAPEARSPIMLLIGEDPKGTFESIADELARRTVISVAHVRNNHHFVLLTGANKDTRSFIVNDPANYTNVYPYDNVSDIIRFKVNRYPLFKQCDPRWGSDIMGANNKTICMVGCLMNSITSALAGVGIPIYNQPPTPKILNVFLRAHNGYVDNTSALDEDVVALINPKRIQWPADGMHTKNDLSFATIIKYLHMAPVPRIVIANVEGGGHFVHVVGYRSDNDTLVVHDSGYTRHTYSYSKDVVGWRIFDMK